MPFQGEELSIQLIEALVPLMPRIKPRGKDLENQLRRSNTPYSVHSKKRRWADELEQTPVAFSAFHWQPVRSTNKMAFIAPRSGTRPSANTARSLLALRSAPSRRSP